MRLISKKEISLIAEANKDFIVETFIKIQGSESDEDSFYNLNQFICGYESALREYDEDKCFETNLCDSEIYKIGRQTCMKRISQLVNWEMSREIFHIKSKFDDLMPKKDGENE